MLRGAARVLTGTSHYFKADFIERYDERAQADPSVMRKGKCLLDAVAASSPRTAQEWRGSPVPGGLDVAGRGLKGKGEDQRIFESLKTGEIEMPLWGVSLDRSIAESYGKRFLFLIDGPFHGVAAWRISDSRERHGFGRNPGLNRKTQAPLWVCDGGQPAAGRFRLVVERERLGSGVWGQIRGESGRYASESWDPRASSWGRFSVNDRANAPHDRGSRMETSAIVRPLRDAACAGTLFEGVAKRAQLKDRLGRTDRRNACVTLFALKETLDGNGN